MPDFLDLRNAYQFNYASGIVIVVTQAVQWLTGWQPWLVGAAVSLLIATLRMFEKSSTSLSWDMFWELLLRACQLFVYCGTICGFITKGWRGFRAKMDKQSLATQEAGKPSHLFWKPWF